MDSLNLWIGELSFSKGELYSKYVDCEVKFFKVLKTSPSFSEVVRQKDNY
jgi:hypothetical protein